MAVRGESKRTCVKLMFRESINGSINEKPELDRTPNEYIDSSPESLGFASVLE